MAASMQETTEVNGSLRFAPQGDREDVSKFSNKANQTSHLGKGRMRGVALPTIIFEF